MSAIDYPKISIVTPSYNQGLYLEDTIKSVVNQGYPNLEYIIIDGGSTDNSVEIIKKYEQHLRYWISEKDKGLYDALQKGFSVSTGDIMAWINSDDMYHNKSLFAVAKLFMSFSHVNWIMGRNTFFNNEGIVYQNLSKEDWSKWRFYNFNKKDFIQQESVFWRRSLWNKAGGKVTRELKLAGDFELWLRFFRHETLYTTNLILAGFRFRNGHQKSQNHFKEYVAEVETLIHNEIQCYNLGNYLFYLKIVKVLLAVIPIKKWRMRLWHKALKIPEKIIYHNLRGFYFGKSYK